MSEDDRVDELLAVVRDILAGPDLTADDDLTEHGATSLAMVRIVMEASLNLQLDIDPAELGDTITVRNMARIATTEVAA